MRGQRLAVYGTWHHMKAVRIFYDRMEYPDGSILEMTIWQVQRPVLGSTHRLKYSLFYGRPGKRLICYDNERGKGDHRHYEGREEPYSFTTPEALIEDFLADVKRVRGEL
jgi:Family of unknown function (DUF6516)